MTSPGVGLRSTERRLAALLLASLLAVAGTAAPASAADAVDGTVTTREHPLTERTGPGTKYEPTGRMIKKGTTVHVVCQTRGETITGYFGTSDLWDQLKSGGWVSDTYVFTGSDGQVAPDCADPPTRNGSGGGGTPGPTGPSGWRSTAELAPSDPATPSPPDQPDTSSGWRSTSELPAPPASGPYVDTTSVPLTVRAEPSTASAKVGSLPDLAPVALACQTEGEEVAGGTFGTTQTWFEVAGGGYVSAAYVNPRAEQQPVAPCAPPPLPPTLERVVDPTTPVPAPTSPTPPPAEPDFSLPHSESWSWDYSRGQWEKPDPLFTQTWVMCFQRYTGGGTRTNPVHVELGHRYTEWQDWPDLDERGLGLMLEPWSTEIDRTIFNFVKGKLLLNTTPQVRAKVTYHRQEFCENGMLQPTFIKTRQNKEVELELRYVYATNPLPFTLNGLKWMDQKVPLSGFVPITIWPPPAPVSFEGHPEEVLTHDMKDQDFPPDWVASDYCPIGHSCKWDETPGVFYMRSSL